MSLGQANEATARAGPRSRRILALVVAPVLCLFALLLAAGEARAQQLHTPAEARAAVQAAGIEPPATVADAETIAEAAEPLVEAPPVEALSAGLVSATVDWLDPVTELALEPTLPWQPVPDPASLPDPAGEPLFAAGAYPATDPTAPAYPGPAPGPAPGSVSGPAPGLQVLAAPAGPVPEPVGFEKNEPLMLLAREQTAPLPAAAPPPLPRNGTGDAASFGPSPDGRKAPAMVPLISKAPASNVPKTPVVTPGVPARLAVEALRPPNLEAAASSAVEALQDAAATAAGESPPEPAGTEGTTGDTTPRPSSPLAPIGGSSFSLSGGGGQAGPGGVVPLLLCVLASGLILLRRDGPLSLTFCELPEPSSVLLVPLERPG